MLGLLACCIASQPRPKRREEERAAVSVKHANPFATPLLDGCFVVPAPILGPRSAVQSDSLLKIFVPTVLACFLERCRR